MQRLSILAIVVTLVTGPVGATICHAFCADGTLEQECHGKLAAVVAADCCDSTGMSATVVVASESRHETLSSPANVGVAQHLVQTPAICATLTRNKPHTLHATSLAMVLRI